MSRSQLKRTVAWAVWSLSLLSSAVGVVMIPFTHHLRPYVPVVAPGLVGIMMLLEMVSSSVFVIFASVGLLLVLRQPGNRMGLWGLAIGLAGSLNTICGNYTMLAYVVAPEGWQPLAPLAAWIGHWMTLAATVIGAVFIPLFFPDGRLPSDRWRPFFLVAIATLLTQFVLLAFARMDVLNYAAGYGIANPYGLWTLYPTLEAGAISLVLALVAAAGYIRYRQTAILALAVGFILLSWLSVALGVGGLTVVAILVGVVVSIAQRLRRANGVQLEQIKWMAWSFSLVAVFALARALGGGEGTPLGVVIFAGFTLSWVVAAISLGIALFQYRLYDIDIIIRKTLVYTVLTVLLALIYFGSVTLFTGLFSQVSGQQSALAIVISTLIIAALFTPLRRRIQDWIDRRFYRKKYDARQVLAQFAATARQETDLDALTAELMRAVEETMQPEGISLWLMDSHR